MQCIKADPCHLALFRLSTICIMHQNSPIEEMKYCAFISVHQYPVQYYVATHQTYTPYAYTCIWVRTLVQMLDIYKLMHINTCQHKPSFIIAFGFSALLIAIQNIKGDNDKVRINRNTHLKLWWFEYLFIKRKKERDGWQSIMYHAVDMNTYGYCLQLLTVASLQSSAWCLNTNNGNSELYSIVGYVRIVNQNLYRFWLLNCLESERSRIRGRVMPNTSYFLVFPSLSGRQN